MKIIDSHLHVWSNDTNQYPLNPERPTLPKGNATAEFLLECLDEAGVAGALIVQPIVYGFDHRYVTECLRKWPDRFVGMCLINPKNPNAPAELERLVKEEGYRGVRVNPGLFPQGVGLDSEISDRIFEKAGELNIAIGFLINPEHFDAVDVLMTRHPEVQVIIDHFGRCKAEDISANSPFQKLLSMAHHPKLHIKVSGFPVSSSPKAEGVPSLRSRVNFERSEQDWPYRDVQPMVKKLIETYGARRLMWGTDFPFIVQQCGYTRGLTLLSQETPGIAPEDMEWLLGKTVQKVFGEFGQK